MKTKIRSMLESVSAWPLYWTYLLAIYPALITIPYFVVTERYASWTRVFYVILCTLLAASLLFLILSPTTQRLRLVITKTLGPHTSWLLSAVVIAYGLLMYYLVYEVRLQNGMGLAVDVAVYEQVFWAGTQGHWFYSSFNNGTYLSGHFSPILIPLTILYGLASNIGAIFALQSLILAAAAIPLYLFARDVVGKTSAVIISISFLVSPAVIGQHFSIYLNHFAPFFWLLASVAFWRKNILAFVFFSVLVASVQEDIAFSLLIFALLAWREKRSRLWRLFTILFPLLWFVAAMMTIQANATLTGTTLGRHFVDLGRTPWEIGQTLLENPTIILTKLFNNAPSKALWTYELLSPLLFILPLASLVSLAAVPDWLVFVFIPLDSGQYSVLWYMSLFITTVLFMALVYALYRFNISTTLSENLKSRIVKAVSVLVLCSNLAMLPLVLSPEMFKVDGGDQRIETLRRIKTLIPSDACVATTYDVTQPFAQRFQLRVWGTDPDNAVLACQYFVVSQDLVNSRPDDLHLKEFVRILESNDSYQLVLAENQIQFFARK